MPDIRARSKVRFLALLLVVLLLLAGCGENESGAPVGDASPAFSMRDDLLGTVISITAYDGAKESDLKDALALVAELDDRLSINKENSEISQINQRGAVEAVAVSPDTYELLEEAQRLAKASAGAFDPTIGGLTGLWREEGVFARLPEQEELAATLPGVGFEKLLLADGSVRLGDARTQLDLGGIAKGYACERAAEFLRERGVRSALLDFGGNIYALGARPGKEAYTIGVTVPYPGENGVALSLAVRDASVVTSGAYERNFEQDGRFYHHILEPNTGYPVENDLLSVTIITPSSTVADGLSTVCFVLGAEAGRSFLENWADAEGIFITSDGLIHVTSGLLGKVTSLDSRFVLEAA